MKKIAYCFILVALFIQGLNAMELPKPPSGFSWQEIPEIKAAFLKPDGWLYHRDEQKGTLGYFITKEWVGSDGQFQTGLTVNVFRGLRKGSAIEKGKELIDNMASTHHATSFSRTSGSFQEFGCDLRDTDASGTIFMHALTIANPKTDTLYLFIFESPESEWNSAWKIGEQIMDSLAIDDAI